MTLEWPIALLALLAVPLAVAVYRLAQRRRMRYAVRFTNLDVLSAVVERSASWRRRLPAALALLALAALATAFARPHVNVAVPREQATVVLVIDTSGSMMARDVRPTRLDAAKAAVQAFLKKVPDKLRVGIVSFSSDAQVVAPPTADRRVVGSALEYLTFGFRTAIGDAIGRAVVVARETEEQDARGEEALSPPAPAGDDEKPLTAILLLSDGHQNWGLLEPLEAAQRAKQAGIPVFTVALGTPNGVLETWWSGTRRLIPVPPDPETLRQIAQATGGQAFQARDGAKLKAVYEELGSRLGHKTEEREVTVGFLAGGAALLLSSVLLSALWLPRLP